MYTMGTKDVYIIGTGMVGYRQLTDECRELMKRAERIYLLHPLPEVKRHIANKYQEPVDLTEQYEQGQERARAYKSMAETVLDSASEADGPVVMAVYGHPTVGVTPTGIVRRRGDKCGISVSVFPGISSLDCLYTELGVNPLDRGLQVFEATDLLVYQIDLDTAMPAFVMQVGLVGTHLYDNRESAPERFVPLREYLQTHYPDDHVVYFVRTATIPLADTERIPVRVDEFESVADRVDKTHTLYIPPAQERSPDERLASKARSPEHLDRITRE